MGKCPPSPAVTPGALGPGHSPDSPGAAPGLLPARAGGVGAGTGARAERAGRRWAAAGPFGGGTGRRKARREEGGEREEAAMDDLGCPRCKTTKYRNPSLKLMVNVCGHTL